MGGCRGAGGFRAYRGTSGRECPSTLPKFTTVPVPPPTTTTVKLVLPGTVTASSLSMECPLEGYRRNVGICLIGPSRKIFLAKRINVRGMWQMPQGGAYEGEDLRSAAMRELREETGVTSAQFIAEAPYWWTYDFPSHAIDGIHRRWGTNYRGQAQKWFLYQFTGEEEEINLLGDGSEKPEFDAWSWTLPERLMERVVHFKKPAYQQVMQWFIPHLSLDSNEGNPHLSSDSSEGNPYGEQ